jgi:tetratricopeptide (TPR) repeat protein
MDLQALFDRGMQSADRGQYQEAIAAYEHFIDAVNNPASGVPASQRPQLIRSAAFNLAQVLNKAQRYDRALTVVDLGLAASPTDFGRAIALSAKGEALCGLGRVDEGRQAFDQAAEFHPVVGRLNSADSMTRLDDPEFWDLAEKQAQSVITSYQHMLDKDLRAEAQTVLGKVAARRGDMPKAREHFEAALRNHPDFTDARLQIRILDSQRATATPKAGGRKGFWARLFGSS